jgi:hypothetical protein
MLAPPNDVVSGQLGERLGHVLDWSRHRLILASFWRDAARFGEWRIVPFLAMALPLLGSGWRRLNAHEWIGAVIVALTLGGYYGIYLLTPWDLAWHLDFSLVRLLLQLWPAAILLWCLTVTLREPPVASIVTSSGSIFRRRAALAGLFVANVAVAGTILTALARQLAPNELAAAHVGGGDVSAVIGDGWYERETDGRNLWVWSQGESTLLLCVSPHPAATAVTLRFRVRGLGTRMVSAKIGDRVVWREQVGEQWTSAEIVGLPLSPGVNRVVFTTDAPSMPESANPGARALSFTLYDVRLK